MPVITQHQLLECRLLSIFTLRKRFTGYNIYLQINISELIAVCCIICINVNITDQIVQISNLRDTLCKVKLKTGKEMA